MRNCQFLSVHRELQMYHWRKKGRAGLRPNPVAARPTKWFLIFIPSAAQIPSAW
jgi:hypothetical protein